MGTNMRSVGTALTSISVSLSISLSLSLCLSLSVSLSMQYVWDEGSFATVYLSRVCLPPLSGSTQPSGNVFSQPQVLSLSPSPTLNRTF